MTLEIDSNGNVILAPKTFSLQGKTVDEIANSSAKSAVDGQTQVDIFSKLTNGGKAQGIYLDENGNIYVNGQFIKALSIAANALAAGSITTEKLEANARLDAKRAEAAIARAEARLKAKLSQQ